MKAIPDYKNSAFIVPGSVLEHVEGADRCDLAVLLWVLGKGDFSVTSAADSLGISENDFLASLRYWEECGVLTTGISKKSKRAEKTDKKEEALPEKTKRTSSLPSYTTEETARYLEKNKKTAELIDSCEQLLGKIFTTAETNIVIGMLDHLSLSGDYILLLFAHAVKIGKASVRYVEKMALGLVDRDITKYKELEAELAAVELSETTLRQVRSMFGIGSRVFTAKEKKTVRTWCVDWGFGEDVIGKAYEVTVNATGDASLNYANAVLDTWHAEGLETPEQIDEYLEKHRNAKPSGKKGGKKAGSGTSSFETDDFFEAALKRSYGKKEG
ncbi:MAG: DnaD domain protein [Clostridia bacterium]|nr:DnaD domain protein [Clostridia bacterium]